MTGSLPRPGHLWIVGVGRLGSALGSLLGETGRFGRVSFTGRAASPPELPVFRRDGVSYGTQLPSAADSPDLIIIAVPDAAIGSVAEALAGRNLRKAVVLHTSGVLSSEVLHPLSDQGHDRGSIHPLVAVPGPGAAERLVGAWYGVEGTSGAIEAAEALVELVKGNALRVDASWRPAYHAAAVFASNHVVALLAVAEELMSRAGVARSDARAAMTALARGAIDSVAASTPVAALTGPVSRGDDSTISLHLRGLSGDLRPLYSELTRITLRLAQLQGLDRESAARIVSALEAETP